jgi:glycosyltransferase involved in cell wall biosynthesis
MDNQFTSPPVISVILPVYNGGAYLALSVQSVLAQQFEAWELLVVDDCSTDGSFEYLQNIDHPQVTLFKNEKNKGLFFNLNFLISKCTTNLVKLWSQDDVMYPTCLQQTVLFHKQHPQLGFSYSDRDMIDEHGNIKTHNNVDHTPAIISPELHARIAFFTGSIAGNIANVCINKNALQEVGPFREDMKISADFDMWVRLAEQHDTGFIKQKLIQLRDHSGQLSRKDEYYILHVREDREVYKNLYSYASPEISAEGRKMMRQHKLVFYYTLMLKVFFEGKFRLAHQFYKEIIAFDNFMMVSIQFLKAKIFGQSKPLFLAQMKSEA